MDLSELSQQELQNLYEEIRRELRDLQSERDEIDEEIEAKRLVQAQIDYEIRDRQLVPGEEHPLYRKNLVSVKVFVSPSEQPDDVLDELSSYGYIEGYTFNEATHELIADYTDIRDAEDAIKKLSSRYNITLIRPSKA